ncbi:MAG: hypothetical protein U9N59_08510 [Campylobacterota bacterium]|nr:hypothetical protein [Campylobacterota bacterium]
MKSITFHINNEAYTIDIGEDTDNMLNDGLKKFLTTDKNLSTAELLLAYLRKSQELVALEHEIQDELHKLPSLEQFTS